MQNELGKVVECVNIYFDFIVFSWFYLRFYRLVLPMFSDAHPRVRFAACQCVCVVPPPLRSGFACC
jgi:hypothetical protein